MTDIDPLSFLAHLLLSITAGTLIISMIVYAAYKVREKRKPSATQSAVSPVGDTKPVFLKLYVPKSQQGTRDQ